MHMHTVLQTNLTGLQIICTRTFETRLPLVFKFSHQKLLETLASLWVDTFERTQGEFD